MSFYSTAVEDLNESYKVLFLVEDHFLRYHDRQHPLLRLPVARGHPELQEREVGGLEKTIQG